MDALSDVSVPVEVRLGQRVMSLDDVLSIDPGTLISLDKPAGESLEIRIGSLPFASGEVVVFDGQIAVRVTAFYPGFADLKS